MQSFHLAMATVPCPMAPWTAPTFSTLQNWYGSAAATQPQHIRHPPQRRTIFTSNTCVLRLHRDFRDFHARCARLPTYTLECLRTARNVTYQTTSNVCNPATATSLPCNITVETWRNIYTHMRKSPIAMELYIMLFVHTEDANWGAFFNRRLLSNLINARARLTNPIALSLIRIFAV